MYDDLIKKEFPDEKILKLSDKPFRIKIDSDRTIEYCSLRSYLYMKELDLL